MVRVAQGGTLRVKEAPRDKDFETTRTRKNTLTTSV